MDVRLRLAERERQWVGLVAGFHGPACTPVLPSSAVSWTSDEDGLFRSDITAFVLQDCRLLGDLTLALTVGRPTLFVVNDPVDLAHLAVLQANREIVLTPYDAIYAPAGLPRIEGVIEHMIDDPREWIAAGGGACRLPSSLAAFASFTKAEFSTFAAMCNEARLGAVQHFFRIVGSHDPMAQTMIRTPEMIRVGRGGPFHDFTPTLLFVDPAHTGTIETLALRQSTIVVAPFALAPGDPIDALLAELVDARPEPFHLHDVTTFGQKKGHVFGCVFGEYAM